MKTRIAIIFPDTNLFVQCHPLQALDWSRWMAYDEVHMVLCRSVQRELDDLKTRSNDQAPRARRALKLVRTLLTDTSDHLVVSSNRPIVKLYLDEPGPPSCNLEKTLDYGKPDDELVGDAYRWSQKHTDADVSILTNDTGPMATAKTVGLKYDVIPDKWLIGSQQDSADPDKTRLLARIKELERREPQVKLQFLDGDYITDGKIDIEYLVYEPLSTNEIESYIQAIRKLCPQQTDFDVPEPDVGNIASPFGRIVGDMRGTYKPARVEEIRRYSDIDYPRWLSSCESLLVNLHSTLQKQQPRPRFELAASNVGTRPARDVLVTFVAQGGIGIFAEPSVDTDTPEEQVDEPIDFPEPPQAPAGRWTGPFGDLSAMSSIAANLDRFLETPPLSESPFRFPEFPPHDPNSFYYKPQLPTEPTASFSLECAQWRHRTETKIFEGLISFDVSEAVTAGAITCELHSENISAPVRKVLPIRIRTTRTSTETASRNMLRRLRWRGAS